jgi:hypothetical protein
LRWEKEGKEINITPETPFNLTNWHSGGIMCAMFGFAGLEVPEGTSIAKNPTDVLRNLQKFGVQVKEGERARILSPYFKRITNLLRTFTGIPNIHWYNIEKDTGEYIFAEGSHEALYSAVSNTHWISEDRVNPNAPTYVEFELTDDRKKLISNSDQWHYAITKFPRPNQCLKFSNEFTFDDTIAYQLTGQDIRHSVPKASSDNPTGRYAIFEKAIPQAETIGEANLAIEAISPNAAKDADIFIAALTGYIEFIPLPSEESET